MQNVRRLIERQIARSPNIKIDAQNSIQEIADHSYAMITDFGSVGAEYRLRFAKRVIYLKVPENYEGGGDLLFRDRFADGITEVRDLEANVREVIKKAILEAQKNEKWYNRCFLNRMVQIFAQRRK